MSAIKFVGKDPDGNAIAVKSDALGNIGMSGINRPRATPKGLLSVEILSSYDMTPHSMGADGSIYGAYARKIARSVNGFGGSVELGYDFSTEQPAGTGSLTFATKTLTGYVAIWASSVNNTAAVYYSTSFTESFSKVLDIAGAHISSLNVSVHNKPVLGFADSGLLLLGEYSLVTPSAARKLYISKDGGATWAELLSTTVVSSAANCHWHHSTYDPWSGYIYASQGDGVNAKLWVSKDFGTSFAEIVCPTNDFEKELLQPTLIVPTADKVVLASDQGRMDFPLFAMGLYRSDYRDYGAETFKLYWEKSISPNANPWDNFARYPYAQSSDGAEIYISFPSADRSTPDYVIGSGDGGQSWHVVYVGKRSAANSTFTYGICGIDVNGYIYGYYYTGSAQKVWKAKKIDWLYT